MWRTVLIMVSAAAATLTQATFVERLSGEAPDRNWYLSAARKVEDFVRRHEEPRVPSAEGLGLARSFPEVTTSSGTLIGRTMDESHAFYNVRYGRVPNRYMKLVPAGGNDLINASEPEYLRCFEGPSNCTGSVCNRNYNEECLVLNIFVPSSVDLSNPAASKLPVMFWIHGGGFFVGSGSVPMYDGRFISNTTNTILVAINYRLDALGFLVFEEGDTKFEGNQGFKDQQLALQWVQDNIGQFGGDKNQVTIFGNSAGGQSVMLHLLSDVSKPMFKRALMQSNPAVFYYYTPQEAQKIAGYLLEALNCDEKGFSSDAQCLLETAPEEIVNIRYMIMGAAGSEGDIYSMVEPYRPVVDGVEFIDQPLNLFRDGKWQSDKEVLLGTQTDEIGLIDALFQDRTLPCTLYEFLNTALLGEHFGTAISQAYMELNSLTPLSDCAPTLADELADMFFDCPSRTLARFMSQTSAFLSPPPVYLYANEHALDGEQCYEQTSLDGQCGLALHGQENYFVFGTGSLVGWRYTADDEKVVKMFSDYWGAFAYTGHPSPQADIWPSYVAQAQLQGAVAGWSNVRIKAPSSEVESGYRQDYCDFWDSIGFYVNFTSPTTTSPVETTSSSGGHSATFPVLFLSIIAAVLSRFC